MGGVETGGDDEDYTMELLIVCNTPCGEVRVGTG